MIFALPHRVHARPARHLAGLLNAPVSVRGLQARLCAAVFAATCALPLAAVAQNAPAPGAAAAPASGPPEARVQRITHQDAGSRIDELRVGGMTRQIDVQTASGLPGYQVQPSAGPASTATPASERSGHSGNAGRSSWRLVDF